MLTGDKVETATSIAISAGLKHRRHHLHFMRELTDKKEILDHIKEMANKIQITVLIVDGKTLDSIMSLPEVE